jgi:DNA-directed RNA polymerase subunit H (RpoH/RPB5)
MSFFKKLFKSMEVRKKKRIDYILDNDPVLNKLDKQIGDLNDKAANRLKKDPEVMKILNKLNIDI